MKPLKCLIVDDEPLARQGLAEYVGQIDFLELKGQCKNAVEASGMLKETQADLMFLDIHMPMMSGIEFLREIKHPPLVIFTTAHREYALEGFELEVVDYLLKPISFPRFLRAAQKALELSGEQNQKDNDEAYFYVKEDGVFVKLCHQDILYIEGEKDYIFIHTPEKRHMVLTSMKAAQSRLPESTFMRVHRSYIINVSHVKALEGNTLHIGNAEVPVSKQYRDDVYERIIGNNLWRRE